MHATLIDYLDDYVMYHFEIKLKAPLPVSAAFLDFLALDQQSLF